MFAEEKSLILELYDKLHYLYAKLKRIRQPHLFGVPPLLSFDQDIHQYLLLFQNSNMHDSCVITIVKENFTQVFIVILYILHAFDNYKNRRALFRLRNLYLCYQKFAPSYQHPHYREELEHIQKSYPYMPASGSHASLYDNYGWLQTQPGLNVGIQVMKEAYALLNGYDQGLIKFIHRFFSKKVLFEKWSTMDLPIYSLNQGKTISPWFNQMNIVVV